MTAAPPRALAGSGRGEITVALVGRQNAGKTSLLMHLTGTAQRPVNFPGTSVERIEGVVRLDHGGLLRLVDLPGIGSLQALSRDEEVSVRYLHGSEGRLDVICAVLDAGKLSVELHLLGGLLQLGRPVVVALNKLDAAAAEGTLVDPAALQTLVGVPVIATDGLRGKGVSALRSALLHAAEQPSPSPLPMPAPEIAARVERLAPPRRSRTDRLDAVLLHPLLGLPILLLVMLAMFQLVYNGAEPFVAAIETAQGWLAERLQDALPPGALQSFVVDGLINGVGSVLVFLPQIALLIALVAFLEASGYMARAAFLLDRLLRRVGLSGRSFVPLTTSFACAVPGIMASRIITDERDRLATILVAPLMSCSARLPVYVVLIGAFFPAAWAGVVLLGLYLLGIVIAAVVAFALRRSVLRGRPSMLLMELPTYQRPSLRVMWGQVSAACREFALLAGTVILATSMLIWLLSYYPRPAAVHQRFESERIAARALPPAEREQRMQHLAALEDGAYLEQSALARIGKTIQPVFAPAGFDWRTTVGIVSAFPARELIIPTLGILYSVGDVDASTYDLTELAHAGERHDGLRDSLRSARTAEGRRALDPLTALALMVFFALCSQCAATLGAIRRETRSWRWPAFTFVYMTTLAWLAAVVVQQGGRLLGWGGGA